MKKKIAMIIGVTGQDGSLLTDFLLKKKYKVIGVKRRSSSFNTERIDHIYNDIKQQKNFFPYYGDLTDSSNLLRIIQSTKPDEIYNLGAQSHVHTSFETPEYTANADALGTLRILEAIRILKLQKKTKFYQASTSELFGNTEIPQNEKTPFRPRSPYAISKLYSYWTTRNYRDAYSMFASNGILFNHESPRRGENFISRKAIIGIIKVLKGDQKCLYLGNLKSKRDWGHAKEFVNAQWKILQHKTPDDFVIATGKNYSVKDLVNLVLKKLNIRFNWKKNKMGYEYAVALNDIGQIKKSQIIVKQEKIYFRPNEVHNLVGDFRKAKKILKWKPMIDFEQLISEMIDSDLKNIM